ncbi:MAG TPA: UDP-N-acetylmuramate--L-alanine ligase [Firmicutes bacterium]|nr:UDP-N-acetylmuramate--L-alanine ligase [Bacillota bacterium]
MLERIKHLHFIGIGGYGMSALAQVLLDLGYRVSGSDIKQSPITEKLKKQGATVYTGHDAAHIAGAELVVYSTAIPFGNIELQAAKSSGIPVWHRSELLARFINGRFGIAVAGAHGKTTTTSMIATVLTAGGLDPTAFIGGVLANFGGNARIGKSEIVIAEADESDNTFLRYRPRLAVVTNVEADHLEHYQGNFQLLLDAYREFLNNIVPGGTAVLYAEDRYLRDMYPSHLKKIVTYGLTAGDWRAAGVEHAGWGSRFQVVGPEGPLGRITLAVPGLHNVLNALAAVAVAGEFQVDFSRVQAGLANFCGAERRFQFLYRGNGITVVDDYAHHPTEIRATLQAARADGTERVLVVFQPHRFSRTKWFLEEFARAFHAADRVILHRIYAASELPLAGVSSRELAARMRAHGVHVTQLDEAEEIIAHVLAIARPGDLIITMGAGDITEIGHRLAAKLREQEHAR